MSEQVESNKLESDSNKNFQFDWLFDVEVLIGCIAALSILIGAWINRPKVDYLGNSIHEKTTLNSDEKDFELVRVSRSGPEEWKSEVRAEVGDTVFFAIYYHNSGPALARNLNVKANVSPCTGYETCVQICAEIVAMNSNSVADCAKIEIQNDAKFFTTKNVYWRIAQTRYGNANYPEEQHGFELYSKDGLNLGSIGSGWTFQGSIVGEVVFSKPEFDYRKDKKD